MLKKVFLYGKLKTLCPDDLELEVHSVAEIVRCLCYQVKGFREALSEGYYRVTLGAKRIENCIDESMLHFQLGNTDEIHIVPVLKGAKNGGFGKIVAGIAFVALSFVLPGAGSIAASGLWGAMGAATGLSQVALGLGISMALGGAAAMFTPTVKASKAADYERPEERPSFLYNGPTNTTEQGGPVPIVVGRIRVGSVVCSSGLTTENRE